MVNRRSLKTKKTTKHTYILYNLIFYSLEDYKSTKFELTPGVGYFVANNLAVGVQLSVDRTAVKNGEKDMETTTMVLPFILNYFGRSTIKPFVQAAYGVGWYSGSQVRESRAQSKELSDY